MVPHGEVPVQCGLGAGPRLKQLVGCGFGLGVEDFFQREGGHVVIFSNFSDRPFMISFLVSYGILFSIIGENVE